MPDKASSQTAETGTYNLGETQIELFLENAEAILDDLKGAIEEQVLRDFVDYNFGASAPRLEIVFQPLDAKIKRMLLSALIGLLAQGPVGLADGREVEADWEGLAKDAGVPLTVVDARDRARRLVQAARERLAGLGDEGEAPKGADLSERARLIGGNWREEDHPRADDGKFGDGPGGDEAKDDARTYEPRIEEHPEFTPEHVVDGVNPTGYGVFGPQYGSLSGDGHAAVAHLAKTKGGEVPGALSNPAVGSIDLVWGNEQAGLCKIMHKHPEVITELPEIVAVLEPMRSGRDRVQLGDDRYTAVVKLVYRAGAEETTKTWLLTAFEDTKRTGGS
ncbi:MAG: hypothetical protein KIS66_11820 [Fimbriimonadaceae bacterium]|nr:hypothetical protein [Fimbriimonadaceae bacterium]